MPINSTTEKNALATKYGQDCTTAAICNADPGTLGSTSISNEVSGGSYARQTLSWGAASNGVITASPVFSMPASSTAAWVCLFNAGGTAVDKAQFGASQAFATAGTYSPTLTYTQS